MLDSVPTKVCTRCKRELPATKEYFHRNSSGEYGLHYWCRECRGHKFTHIPNIGYARCPKCKRDLLLNADNFHPRKDSATGFRGTCRECMSKQWANYRQENIEIMRARDRKQDEKRRVAKREYQLKRYRDNPEEEKRKNKESWKKHREKRIAYSRNRYREEPHKYKGLHDRWLKTEVGRISINKCRQKRRAIKKNLLHDFTAEQWLACKEYFDNQCAYCGADAPLEHDLDQEHFIASDNDGPYTVTNIVPSCRSCNSSKYKFDFFDWYPRYEFYSPEREAKILEYLHIASQQRPKQLSLEFGT